MSTFNEIELTTPYGDTDNVLELNIDSISDVYALQGVIKLPSTYTFSIWYRSETDSKVTFNILGVSEIVNSTTGWNKYVKTVTVETLDEPNIYIMSGLNVSTYFYEGYLTEGIADTSWLPAPEDIDGEISSVRSELIQTADRIEAKITASDGRITSVATDLKGITARVESAEGNITKLQQTSEEISLKAGNAEKLAIESKVLSVNLSVETMTVATDTDGNNGSYSNCKTTVSVSYGVDDVTSSSTITCTPANGVTGNWDSSTNVYTITDMTVDTGTVDINATYVTTIDGVEQTLSATRTFSVSKSKQGVKGDAGEGIKIKSMTTEYYLSTSDTEVTGGEWSETPPEKTDTTYIWKREHTVYDDDTESYSSPVLDQSLNKLFVVTAELTVKQNEIRSEVSSVKTEVDNLVYDNRNYALGSGNYIADGKTGWKVRSGYDDYLGIFVFDGYTRIIMHEASTSTIPRILMELSEPLVANEKYTLSCHVRMNTSRALKFIRMELKDSSNSYETLKAFDASEFTADEWTTLIYTFSVSNNGYNNIALTCASFANVDDYIDFEWLKLEKGEKATNWSPAPEDTDQKINDSEENVRTTIAEQTTTITQNCEKMILQAAANYVKTGDYEKFKESVSSQLSIMADQISLNFESTTEQITNVDGDLQSTVETLSKYFDFAIDGLTIHAGEGEMQLVLDNDIIYFKKNGKQFGWWDGVDFYTGNIVIDVYERAQFGNFAFIPRNDGSLSFLKVDDYVGIVITKQPTSSTVTSGTTAKFTITATGSDISYQWQRSISGIQNGEWVDDTSSSAKTATFRIATSSSSAIYQRIRCKITDRKGKELYSDVVGLRVK